MSACAFPGCTRAASVAVKTVRPTRTNMYSTVYYTLTEAPKTAQPYCEPCATHLLTELVHLLGEED